MEARGREHKQNQDVWGHALLPSHSERSLYVLVKNLK